MLSFTPNYLRLLRDTLMSLRNADANRNRWRYRQLRKRQVSGIRKFMSLVKSDRQSGLVTPARPSRLVTTNVDLMTDPADRNHPSLNVSAPCPGYESG